MSVLALLMRVEGGAQFVDAVQQRALVIAAGLSTEGSLGCITESRMTLPIESGRLTLRAYVIDDVAAIHAVLYGDADAMRFIGGVVEIDETRRRIARYIAHQNSNGYSFWAVVDRATGAIAGEAGLIPFGGEGPDVELGYAFAAAFWGRGLATEAGRAVLGEAFGPLGFTRVVAYAVGRDDLRADLHLRRALLSGARRPAGEPLLRCSRRGRR